MRGGEEDDQHAKQPQSPIGNVPDLAGHIGPPLHEYGQHADDGGEGDGRPCYSKTAHMLIRYAAPGEAALPIVIREI